MARAQGMISQLLCLLLACVEPPDEDSEVGLAPTISEVLPWLKSVFSLCRA